MKKKAYTMKDVAMRAGVTQPTVSHVINGTASISKEVCDRVNKVIEELGYIPNAFAKGLKTNKTNIVGLIIPDISNGYYANIAKILEKSLTKKGYASFLACTNYSEKAEEKCIENFLRYNADAVIIAYQFSHEKSLEKLKNEGKPFVLMQDEEMLNDYCVNTDDFFGGYTAAAHLLSTGRKKIAFAGEPFNLKAIENRYLGFKKALEEKEAGRKDNVFVVDDAADKFSCGLILGEKIADSDFDGVFCTSDVIALGVIRALHEKKIKVPDDVAVVGYDDIPVAKLTTPGLTTITQPSEKMANLCVENVIKLINGEEVGKTAVLKPKLTIRETT